VITSRFGCSNFAIPLAAALKDGIAGGLPPELWRLIAAGVIMQ
jgi:hypothetical protein